MIMFRRQDEQAPAPVRSPVDVAVHPDGSIHLFTPLTDEGRIFLKALPTEPWQWLGPALAVDWRPAFDLADEIVEAGLNIAYT